MGLYPNIPHQALLKALRKAIDKRDNKKIPTDDLVKMEEVVLNNNIFDFNNKAFQQESGTAIGTKFAPPYACIYMDETEQSFLQKQSKKPLSWCFTHEASKNCMPFLDLKVELIDGKLETDLYMKPTDASGHLHYLFSHLEHTERSCL